MTVTPATASVGTGKTVQLTATPRDAGGAALTGRVVTWSTGDATRATVSSAGLVTGVAAGGPVTITATSEGQSGTAAVTVTAPIPVTASVTAANKQFDGTTTATITGCTLSGTPAGVTCSAAAATFADAAVGTGKTVTATGITLAGANASLYALTATTATTTADILAAPPPPPPPPPSGNVAFVQAGAGSVFGGSSITVSLPDDATAGNLVVVGVDWVTASLVSISDGQGNAFTQAGTDGATPNGTKLRFYYARNVRGGAEAVTVTMSGSDPILQVYMAEYQGADITNPLDVTVQASGSGSSVSSGTALTTSPNDVVVAFCVSNGTCSVGSGYAARSTHSGNLLEDRTAATPGAYSATATSNAGWAIILAAFRPQGSVIVPPAPVASVSVSPTTATVGIGGTVQLTATPRDAGGTVLTGRTITWSTSDAALAAVNGSGLVTGVASGGPVTITAISEGQSGSAGVTVTAPIPVTASVHGGEQAARRDHVTATITGCALSGSPAGVTCSAAAASFADATVGTGKTVTATGISLGGANAGLYVLTATSATTTADILPPPPCTVTLSSSSRTVSLTGGSFTIGLTAAAGCAWTAASNAAWVTITSALSGSGNTTVRYTVAANTGPQRVGTMTIGGKTFTVTQSTGCAFTIAPTSANIPAGGASGTHRGGRGLRRLHLDRGE